MIEIEFDGQRFTGFTEASVSRSVEAVSGIFSITVQGTREVLPFQRGGAVKLFVDNELFLTGFIEQSITTYNAFSHQTRLTGRSKTADLIDSHVDGGIELNPDAVGGFTLTQLAQKVITTLNLDIIVDDTLVPDLKPFNGDSPFSGEVAEKGFEILERYARKRQVLLTTNGDGSLVFVRGADTLRQQAILVHVASPQDTSFNNILDGEIAIDDSERYNRYIFHSVGNPTFLSISNISKDNDNIVERNNLATDDEIRESRVLQIQAENSTDLEELQERAQWEADVRKSRSLVYRYRVKGHSGGIGIYEPNRIIRVIDDFGFENDTELLIKDVSFEVDNNRGNTTLLTLVRKDAFTLTIAEPTKDKASKQVFKFQVPST